MNSLNKEVLIADDDRLIVNMLSMRCRNLGLRVQTCQDAMQTLVTSHKRLPSLLIIDVTMPPGSGLGVCEMMANDTRLAKIPVIILTGRKNAETQERAESFGAHFFMKSPDVWDKLKPLICQLLDIVPPISSKERKEAG